MSIPPRLEQDVAEDRRMVKLLAGALGATSVVICGLVILLGPSLADLPVGKSAQHSQVPPHSAVLAQVVTPASVQQPVRIDRSLGDFTPREAVDLAAPWLQSANRQTTWRND